jgi:hypothetical protein
MPAERTQTLIVIRGLPSSGKTTVAKLFIAAGFVHIDPEQFPGIHFTEAMRACYQATEKALAEGESVVVSAVLHRRRFVVPYILLAKKYSVQVNVLVAGGMFHTYQDPAYFQHMKDEWEWCNVYAPDDDQTEEEP